MFRYTHGSVGEAGLGNISTTSPKASKEGNLEVDIFESNSKNLVWRGLASNQTKHLGADCEDVHGISAKEW